MIEWSRDIKVHTEVEQHSQSGLPVEEVMPVQCAIGRLKDEAAVVGDLVSK